MFARENNDLVHCIERLRRLRREHKPLRPSDNLRLWCADLKTSPINASNGQQEHTEQELWQVLGMNVYQWSKELDGKPLVALSKLANMSAVEICSVLMATHLLKTREDVKENCMLTHYSTNALHNYLIKSDDIKDVIKRCKQREFRSLFTKAIPNFDAPLPRMLPMPPARWLQQSPVLKELENTILVPAPIEEPKVQPQQRAELEVESGPKSIPKPKIQKSKSNRYNRHGNGNRNGYGNGNDSGNGNGNKNGNGNGNDNGNGNGNRNGNRNGYGNGNGNGNRNGRKRNNPNYVMTEVWTSSAAKSNCGKK